MNQLSFKLRSWGGKRRHAGRNPNGTTAGVSHLVREGFPSRYPVHVTLRTLPDVGYLRGWKLFHAIRDAIHQAQERFGVRVVHFSIQGNHVHLLVEAEGAESLARGMQGLTIRLARAINRAARRRGKVFMDRYHSHILSTPPEVANALRYLLENFRHHLRPDIAPAGLDPCSSAAWVSVPLAPDAPVLPPRTWLLRKACEARAGQLQNSPTAPSV